MTMHNDAIKQSPEWLAAERDRLLNPEGKFSDAAVQLAIETPLTVEESAGLIQHFGMKTARQIAERAMRGQSIADALASLTNPPNAIA